MCDEWRVGAEKRTACAPYLRGSLRKQSGGPLAPRLIVGLLRRLQLAAFFDDLLSDNSKARQRR